MSLLKSLVKIHLTATSIAILSFIVIAESGSAAIVAVGDAGSYNSRVDDQGNPLPHGTDTIASLGFNITPVIDSNTSDGNIVTSLASQLGNVTFSPSLVKATVPTTFATWSHGYRGPVYLSANDLATIDLPSNVQAFDIYVEPNGFGSSDVIATASDGTQTGLSQLVNGAANAQYFGFYTDNGDSIRSVTIVLDPGANPGIPPGNTNTEIAADNSGNPSPADILNAEFAVGQLRVGNKSFVPEPSHGLGTLAFGVLGAAYLLKRQSKKAQA